MCYIYLVKFTIVRFGPFLFAFAVNITDQNGKPCNFCALTLCETCETGRVPCHVSGIMKRVLGYFEEGGMIL